MTGATAALADFSSRLQFDDVPREVVREATRVIVDSLACAIAGVEMTPAALVLDHAVANRAAAGSSSLLNSRHKTSAESAAYANCYVATVLDADETLQNSAHMAVCAVFPALATAEARGLSGRDLITAVVAGYEVAARIAQSLEFFVELASGEIEFSSAGGLGYNVFAAATAAGRSLGLEPGQMACALGIAGWSSPITALPKWWSTLTDRPWTKYTPYGEMGRIGTTAAQLAAAGFHGDPAFLEGDLGYWKLIGSRSCDAELLAGGLGHRWWTSLISYKPYCSARLFHASIDAVLALKDEHQLHPDDIAEVVIETYSMGASDQYAGAYPTTPLDGQFNIPFGIALATHDRVRSPDWLYEGAVHDERLRAFSERVRIVGNRDLTAPVIADLREIGRSHHQPTRVTVRTRSGKEYTAERAVADGDPWDESTKWDDDRIAEKFQRFVARQMKPADAERLLTMLFDLENLSDVTMMSDAINTTLLARS